jgi:sirohydrochlorin cobaltochelatase
MSVSPSSAYFLVSHGSRDPRPARAMERLGQRLQAMLNQQGQRWHIAAQADDRLGAAQSLLEVCDRPGSPLESIAGDWVGTGTLELADQPLHQQIIQFAQRVRAGCTQLQILPLFLLPGVHVMEDIPAEVNLAQQALLPNVVLRQHPYLGSHSGLIDLLVSHQSAESADAWILLAHGSRRAGGNQPVEAIAAQLGLIPAYWSVSPDLSQQVQQLIDAGHRRIGILPYFLFAGGITDAIAQTVAHLAQTFPQATLHLAPPLGDSDALPHLLWEFVKADPVLKLP